MWLGNLKVMVRVVNGWQVNSWDLWCRVLVEVVGRIGYVTVMVVDDRGCC
jgi:hypothetical protein